MGSVKRGEDLYREWHDKEPQKHISLKENKLNETHACRIGRAVQILYRSAKWETKAHEYIHDFDSKPAVYLVESDAGVDETIGRPVKVTSLLGIRDRKSALVVTQLGTVIELLCEDAHGEQFELSVGKGALLLGTSDKKTLLIITKKGPIFIRGGQMKITSRGIVK